MDKLEKLNHLLKAIKKDVVTPKDIELFVAVFLEEVKKAKDNLEIVTNDKVAYLEAVLAQFEKKRTDLLENIDSSIEEREKYLTDEFGNTIDTLKASVSSEIAPLRDVLSESIKEAQAIIKQLKKVKIKDGKDADETLIVDRVLEKIVLPEYKETVLDNGEQIVDKINALDLSDENKIDASHIKNLPKTIVQGSNISKSVYQLEDVKLTNLANNEVLKYNSTTKLWENGTGGGGSLTLQTDGVVNGDQSLLNLEAGTNITLTDNLAGTVTIDAAFPALELEVDGVMNNDQTKLNLIAGTNINLTDDGLGGVIIDVTGGISDSFETVSKNLQSYDYTINYNGSGDVSSIVYSAGITKTFNYTSGDVTSIVLSGSTPSGIDLTKSLTYDLDGNVEEITYS